MGTLYENIIALCNQRGIKGGKMCTDIGMSKGILTDLKMGRQSGISTTNAQKIADYFGVSVDFLLGKEKAPTSNGERQPDILDEIDIAFYGDYRELSEDDKETLRAMARVMKERMAKRKQEK